MIIERTGKRARSRLLIPGIIVGVVITALGVLTYHQSGNPQVCGSCHSMKPVYESWQVSNHQQFSCVECHQPDTHLPGIIAYKTKAGLNDLYHETTRSYPARISLSSEGQSIVTGNCLRCHASTTAATRMADHGANCLSCHRFVVHGRGVAQGGINVE